MGKMLLCFTLGVALLLPCAVAAQKDHYKGVYVLQTDGSRTLVDLGEGVYARFLDENTLSIGRTDEVVSGEDNPLWVPFFNISADKLSGFEMTTETSGVKAIDADLALRPDINGNSLIIRGAKPGTVANVFTADGKLVLSREVAADDVIDLNGFNPGIYIINLQGLSCKMIVK